MSDLVRQSDEDAIYRMARAMDAWTLAEAGWTADQIARAMATVPAASANSLNLARVALSALRDPAMGFKARH